MTIGGKPEVVPFGAIRLIPLGFKNGKDGEPERAEAIVEPAKGFDSGAGKGKAKTITVTGGAVGIVIDARGRPLVLPGDDMLRSAKLIEWLAAMDLPGTDAVA